MSHQDPAAAVLARLVVQDECCGSEPPPVITTDDGTQWRTGDCWCTLPVDHTEPQCVCEICRARFGAPGWWAVM